MKSTRNPARSQARAQPKDRSAPLWHAIEIALAVAMLTLPVGTLFTLLNWPLRLSGMNYWLLIIPYLSLTAALVTTQFIRRRVQRKETL